MTTQPLTELMIGTRGDGSVEERLAQLYFDAASILVDDDPFDRFALAPLQERERPVLVTGALREARDALGLVGERRKAL